jgi:multiple sugar transport system permease protein
MRRGFFYVVLGAMTLASVFPFLFSLAMSFRQPEHAFAPGVLPNPATVQNYADVVVTTPLFLRWVMNSVLIAAVSVVLILGLALMGGFAFARIPFVGRAPLLVLMLGSMMIPQQVLWIPNYATLAKVGWVNSWWGLVPGFTVTLTSGIFLTSQFMKSLPRELEEAALLDGLGRFGTFRHIILPLTGPVAASLVITSFMASWNSFAWPVIVLNSPELFTLPIGLNFFKGVYVTRWTLIMAASMFNTVPVLVVFVAFQRYFIKGVATTGMKD